MIEFSWRTATKIVFGIGVINKLPEFLNGYDIKSVCVFIGESLVKLGLLERIKQLLAEFNLYFYTKLRPEPTIDIAREAVNFARSRDMDAMVGVGGGSTLDVTKLASLMVTNKGDIEDYIEGKTFKNRGLFTILVPTTAGSGSEVTGSIVLASNTTKNLVIYSDYAFADLAVIDPELTKTMPNSVTAYTGIDALSHGIESFISRHSTPFSEALSVKAIELILHSLPEAYKNGENLQARSNMSLAAMMASMAWVQAGCVLGHAIALALGGIYKLPHGIACGVSLPIMLKYNLRGIGNRKIAELKKLLNSDSIVYAVRDFIQKLNLPSRLSDIKRFHRKDIKLIVKESLKAKRLLVHNPMEVSEDKLSKLLQNECKK